MEDVLDIRKTVIKKYASDEFKTSYDVCRG